MVGYYPLELKAMGISWLFIEFDLFGVNSEEVSEHGSEGFRVQLRRARSMTLKDNLGH
jgi:hypothetical protein